MNGLEREVHRAAGWSLVWSVLMMIAGLIAMTTPLVAGFAVTAVVGWLLMFSGVLHLGLAWRGGGAAGVVWEILLGAVYGAIGFYVIANPIAGLASLTLALAAYLLVEAVLEFSAYFQLRPAAGAGWLMYDAIVTFVLATMIATTWPTRAMWVVGTMVGISMLFSGITRFLLWRAVRRLVT